MLLMVSIYIWINKLDADINAKARACSAVDLLLLVFNAGNLSAKAYRCFKELEDLYSQYS